MWSIVLNVVLKKKKSDTEIPEKVKKEISELLDKYLESGELDDYAVEIEF